MSIIEKLSCLERKFQVFVSSPFVGMEKEREAAIKAILDSECIPIGMEMFPPTSEDALRYIKKVIDQSDFYLVMLGASYGTINPTYDISYTELEYNYALKKKKPIIVCISSNANTLLNQMDEKISKKYRNFFSKLRKNRIVPEFSNDETLTIEIYKALSELKKNPNSSAGFVRANEITKLLTEDIETFESEDSAVAYINEKTAGAEKSICRASLDNQALRNKTDAKVKYWKEKENTLIRDTITYRYVTILYSDTGADKLKRYNEFINKKKLEKFHGSFYVAPLNFIPVLSFIIIDDHEVFTRDL